MNSVVPIARAFRFDRLIRWFGSIKTVPDQLILLKTPDHPISQVKITEFCFFGGFANSGLN